jgi:hypothetical protein
LSLLDLADPIREARRIGRSLTLRCPMTTNQSDS